MPRLLHHSERLTSSKALTIIDVPLRRYPNVEQDAVELLSSGSSGRYARLEDIRAKRRKDCLGDRRGASPTKNGRRIL
jgi:hypothetical protein